MYPDVPQSEFEEHSTLMQDPFEHVCPEAQVCFNLASVVLEHLALTVPGLEQV